MKAISNDIEFRGSEDKTIKSEDGKSNRRKLVKKTKKIVE